MALILVWILNAVALLVVAYLLPGIAVASFGSALIAALVLGLVNMLVKPVLVLLTLPITIVTLGLFLIVINALLFWFVGSVLKGFQVNGFWWAVGGAILYSIISGLLTKLIPLIPTPERYALPLKGACQRTGKAGSAAPRWGGTPMGRDLVHAMRVALWITDPICPTRLPQHSAWNSSRRAISPARNGWSARPSRCWRSSPSTSA